MVTAVTSSAHKTPPDLTEDLETRAVDVVMGLLDGNGLRDLPAMRGEILMHLCTDEGRRWAHRLVVLRYGYVTKHPAAFVALHLANQSWPSGI